LGGRRRRGAEWHPPGAGPAALRGARVVHLAHQDLEERAVGPRLERTIGREGAGAIHQAIIASIPPEEMAVSLALMLPAMNNDDRTELLGGMQAGAPPEVFEGVWSLAGSVLTPGDVAVVGRRLGR
jgi:hypothetical protein